MLSSHIQLYFIGFLLSSFGGYIPTVGGLCSLAGLIVCLVALKRLSGENQHLNDAFRFEVYAVFAAVLVLLAMVIPFLALILPIVSVVLSLLAMYHLFYGFEEVAATHRLAYPQGRMQQCFTVSILSGVVGVVVSMLSYAMPGFSLVWIVTLVGVACSIIITVCLYQFLQATKQASL